MAVDKDLPLLPGSSKKHFQPGSTDGMRSRTVMATLAPSRARDQWLREEQRLGSLHGPQPDEAPGNEDQRERELFKRLHDEWYLQERERQADNRYEMARDEDYYDSIQWTEEEIRELQDRGQAPYVYNVTKQAVDWLCGTERRTRVQWKVLPRKEADVGMADIKHKVLKYVEDINHAGFARSEAFDIAVKAGLAWLEEGVRNDPTQDPLYFTAESWRCHLHDSLAKKIDLSDARYHFRWKFVDLDTAIAIFPKKETALRQAAILASNLPHETQDDFWYLGQHFQVRDAQGNVISPGIGYSGSSVLNNRRPRVKLIECWYKIPIHTVVMRGEKFDGQLYDPQNAEHTKAADEGVVSLYEAVKMQVRLAMMTDTALLHERESPFRHNRFPFTPVWCYRRARDNMPYGVIRAIRDPQDDINKRASKSLFIMSTNQIEMEEGAVEDKEELRQEAARPDGILEFKKGKEFRRVNDLQLAEAHLKLMDRDVQFIERASGITSENRGLETNLVAGIAIKAKQEQGAVTSAPIFDNARLAVQISGEKMLSLTEQYYTEPKVIRITGQRRKQTGESAGPGRFDWIKINQPELQPDGSVRFLNDITESEADFVVDEEDYTESVRQALFEQLMGAISKLPPAIGVQLLDLAFEMMDLPQSQEITRRIAIITGHVDPSVKLTPAEQQQVAMAKALRMKGMMADVEGKVADVLVKHAKADSETAKKLAVTINAMYAALEGGAVVSANPGVAPVADTLLDEAGFKSASGQGAQVPTGQPDGQPAPDKPGPPVPQAQPDKGGPPTPAMPHALPANVGHEAAVNPSGELK